MKRLPPIIQFHFKRHQAYAIHFATWSCTLRQLAQEQIGHTAAEYRKISSVQNRWSLFFQNRTKKRAKKIRLAPPTPNLLRQIPASIV